MRIIPYYIQEQGSTKIAWVFLSQGGKKAWKTDEPGALTNGKPIPSEIEIWRPFIWFDDEGWIKEAQSNSLPFSWDGLSSP